MRGSELARLQDHRYCVFGVAWSPDGKRLATASGDRRVIAWDADTHQKLSTMSGHSDFVVAVDWSPDGTRLASAGIDNSVRVWDPRSGEETIVFRGNLGRFDDVSWRRDGAQLAAAGSDGLIWVWDATRGFERDTTARAWPYIERKVASGTARGEDRLAFAQFAYDQKKFTLAARLWGEALESDPKRFDDRRMSHRYNAARAAALAAAGQGQDEPALDDAAKAKLRRQALDWLKAVLSETADHASRAQIIASAAPLPGLVEQLAQSAPNDGPFQAELARYYAGHGNNQLADAAFTKARALMEAKLVKEPENSGSAAELAQLLLGKLGPNLALTEPDWVVLQPADTTTESGAKLTAQQDGSILVEAAPNTEQQTVRWQPGPQPIRAVRIETSTHEYQTVAATMAVRRPGALRGQFVRLDLPGDNNQFPRAPNDGDKKAINLAELQVFHGDQNIALRKKARQSSTLWGQGRLAPENAVDGNTVGNDSGNPYAHTDFENNPWWEVDLGSEQAIDRIVIWNRIEFGLYVRMNHFRVRVLDRSRKVAFEQVVDKAPNPSTEIVPHALLVETKSAATEQNQPLILRLPRNPLKDVRSRYRVSVATRLADLGLEEKRVAALKLTDPWAMLAAAYHVLGDQPALDTLLEHHPAAAAGIGDLYAATQDWERAIAAYRKLVTDQRADVALLTKLAMAYQSAGRTRDAVPYLAKASAAQPKDTSLFQRVTTLQAWFGQEKELADTCQRGLELAKDTTVPETADIVAKAWCLLPRAEKAQRTAALTLAHKAVDQGSTNPNLPYFHLALGMAAYRSGHWAAADRALLAASRLGTNNYHVSVTTAFYQAMSLFRQGKEAEARQLAAEAAAKMRPLPADEKNPLEGHANADDLILWMAYNEAKAMMKFDMAPPPKEVGHNN
jgi:tetratricopeptide (TPR) repeat protein